MSEKKKSKDTPDLITRRGFVSHAAAAGGGGVLAHVMGGQVDPLHAESIPAPTPEQASIPRRPFGNTGAEIPIVGFGAGSRFYGSTPDDESAAELIRAAIDRGIAFVETGVVKVDRLMTARFKLEQWSEAMDLVAAGGDKCIKAIIEP